MFKKFNLTAETIAAIVALILGITLVISWVFISNSGINAICLFIYLTLMVVIATIAGKG